MRVTGSMMAPIYNRNLRRNIPDLAPSNLKLSSERQYNHVSENPAIAPKAFAVGDQITGSEEYISVVKNARGKLDIADPSIVTLNSILETVYKKATEMGDTSSQDSMNAIAEELGGLKEEILQTMNAKYGNRFLFSGLSNGEAPFTVDGDGNPLFNNKSVDAYNRDDLDTRFDENKSVYLDIGFGTYALGTNATKTGTKVSTSGADMLGYGEDENGLPSNLYSLIGKVEEQLRGGDKEEAMDTLSQLKKKRSSISIVASELGAGKELLDHTEDRLETRPTNPQKSQIDLESVRIEAEAINNKSYGTAWMITLQLGSSVILPSTFDFTK